MFFQKISDPIEGRSATGFGALLDELSEGIA
jgi:hypothetical protein